MPANRHGVWCLFGGREPHQRRDPGDPGRAPRIGGNLFATSYGIPERGIWVHQAKTGEAHPAPGSPLAGIPQRPARPLRRPGAGRFIFHSLTPGTPFPPGRRSRVSGQGRPGTRVPAPPRAADFQDGERPRSAEALGLPRLCLLGGQRQEREARSLPRPAPTSSRFSRSPSWAWRTDTRRASLHPPPVDQRRGVGSRLLPNSCSPLPTSLRPKPGALQG